MEEFIARENIRRFEAQLAHCEDERQRQVLLRLLGAERERLKKIQNGNHGAAGEAPAKPRTET